MVPGARGLSEGSLTEREEEEKEEEEKKIYVSVLSGFPVIYSMTYCVYQMLQSRLTSVLSMV